MLNKTFLLSKAFIITIVLTLTGCATTALQGVTPEGNTAYIGVVPIEKTQAYQTFLNSPQSELNRIQYLLNRIKASTEVTYNRNGTTYSSEDAYKAGVWLIGNSYNKGEDASTFLRDHVWYAKPSMRAHLAQLPGGSVQVAYYLFLNELALLDDTIQKATD